MNIALSCNNDWGVGGQGNFLRRASFGLHPHGSLSVYCCEAAGAASAPFGIVPVGRSRLANSLGRVPVLRRHKDIVMLANDIDFDRRVARRLGRAPTVPDIFVGVAMQSADSMRVVKRRGGQSWLYCLNAYIPLVKAEVDREYTQLGESGGAIHPHGVRRFLDECRLADAILVNSAFAAKSFVDAGIVDKPVYILNPVVDSERFHPPTSRHPNEKLSVLYVGTITPRKGVHYLTEAVSRLDPARAELLLVGGISTRRMRELLDAALRSSNVRQTIKNFAVDEPSETIGQADVLVLPSVEDGFGVVALEAMACGVPAIVTSNCGAADAIEEGQNGFVVPPRDPQAIADRIRWMMEHPTEMAEMRVRARQTAIRFCQTRYDADMAAVVRNWRNSSPAAKHA